MKVGEQDVGIFEKTKDRVTHKMNGDRDAAYAMASFGKKDPKICYLKKNREGILTIMANIQNKHA